jgi:protocatechuate 3,4-dioxygenase beta subunit
VKAAATGVSSVSFSATVSAASLSALTLTSGNDQTAQAGTQLSQALVVTCADQYGNPISGTSVTFSDNPAGGSFSANPVSSDSNGRATVSYTAPTKAGAVTVKAAATGAPSVSFSATVSAASLSALALTSGGDQTAQAGTQLSQAVVVTCADQYGNPVSGTSVTFSDSAAGGSFSPNPVSSDSNGRATVSYTAPTRAGAVTGKAAATGVSSVSFSEAVIATSASALNIISGNDQSGAAGSTLATQLMVQVTDVYGNSVSGTPVSFSDNSAGGSFSTNPIGSDTSGLAGVAYTLPAATGSVTVTAAAPGLASVPFNETAVVGPAATLSKVSGDSQTATPGSPLPLPLVVLVTDQYGNPVSGVAVTFDDAAANGAFSGNPIMTDSSGSASVEYTTPPVSQPIISITASVSPVISVVFSETAP